MKLDWPDCKNARDVGGLPTMDGGVIRAGALLRSDHHGRLTPASIATIKASGVRRILDLRWPRELASAPSPFAGDPVYLHVPMLEDEFDHETPEDSYIPMVSFHTGRIAAAFAGLADAPAGGVVVHCHGGRDRTGVLVALALSVAGVPADEVAADYALTPGVHPDAIPNTLRHLDARYGGVTGYLRAIGVRDEQISAVRRRMR